MNIRRSRLESGWQWLMVGCERLLGEGRRDGRVRVLCPYTEVQKIIWELQLTLAAISVATIVSISFSLNSSSIGTGGEEFQDMKNTVMLCWWIHHDWDPYYSLYPVLWLLLIKPYHWLHILAAFTCVIDCPSISSSSLASTPLLSFGSTYTTNSSLLISPIPEEFCWWG